MPNFSCGDYRFKCPHCQAEIENVDFTCVRDESGTSDFGIEEDRFGRPVVCWDSDNFSDCGDTDNWEYFCPECNAEIIFREIVLEKIEPDEGKPECVPPIVPTDKDEEEDEGEARCATPYVHKERQSDMYIYACTKKSCGHVFSGRGSDLCPICGHETERL